MLLTTRQAAELIEGATQSAVYDAVRVARDHGLRPKKLRGRGNSGKGGRYYFSVSQLIGILSYHVLRKTGLDADVRRELMLHIGAIPDEQLELMLDRGQHYLFKFGRRAVPELWTPDQINVVQTERADVLKQLGLSVVVIDLRPFIEATFELARRVSNPANSADQPEGRPCE